tara:strand:+ start:116 stop:268 length:153 start_codon:yes stop_codon:yes gene_type:complete
MALNDTFTIKEIDMNAKDLSYNVKANGIEIYWENECEKHPTNNHCKIYCD